MPIISKGKVEALNYSRYWAQKQGKRAVGRPGNLIMEGGTKSTADLVRETQKGVLVTRTWYIRMVDPQTVLLTGLTRDGTFYIENGQDQVPDQELPLQRVAGDHAQQHRGTRQVRARGRRRVPSGDDAAGR